MIDFVRLWAAKSGLAVTRFIKWLGISPSKYYEWQNRYGKANEHNALIPRDFWLEEWGKQEIINVHLNWPLEGYRRLTFMMLDQNIVAVSPSSVYRVLSAAGLLKRWNNENSKKGKGFVQPEKPHEHWHIDISYVNLRGTFYYLCSILDGYSRSIVHWELRPSMIEREVEVIVQRAREKFPDARPRIISDNGPQFIARDFKEFIRLAGMTHVRTSPFYPQSNGKLERYHKTIKAECIRPKVALSLEDAINQIDGYVRHYNENRLHSAIGYITPMDKLEGRDMQIFKERDQKLDAARKARKQKRQETKTPLASRQISTTTDTINQLTQQTRFSISS
jgi:transposase InsO family protein